MRASLMPPRWRSVGGGTGGATSALGRGAAGGAVCAALVGTAPLPRAPDLTPSTDLSTLNDTGTVFLKPWPDFELTSYRKASTNQKTLHIFV